MFQLNKSIKEWSENLKTSGIYNNENIVELEDHLQNEIEKLLGLGLSEKEAFYIAANRLGNSDQLNVEFLKVNFGGVWKRRLFWMGTGVLFFFIFNYLLMLIVNLSTIAAAMLGFDRYSGVIYISFTLIAIATLTFFIYHGLIMGKLEDSAVFSKSKLSRSGRIIFFMSLPFFIIFLKIISTISTSAVFMYSSVLNYKYLIFFNADNIFISIFVFGIIIYLIWDWKESKKSLNKSFY